MVMTHIHGRSINITILKLQEVRSVILEAHEAFQATVAPLLRRNFAFSDDDNPSKSCSMTQKPTMEEGGLNFVELAALWQAPLYEISLLKSIDGELSIFATC